MDGWYDSSYYCSYSASHSLVQIRNHTQQARRYDLEAAEARKAGPVVGAGLE